jgi:hypothetical protein
MIRSLVRRANNARGWHRLGMSATRTSERRGRSRGPSPYPRGPRGWLLSTTSLSPPRPSTFRPQPAPVDSHGVRSTGVGPNARPLTRVRLIISRNAVDLQQSDISSRAQFSTTICRYFVFQWAIIYSGESAIIHIFLSSLSMSLVIYIITRRGHHVVVASIG